MSQNDYAKRMERLESARQRMEAFAREMAEEFGDLFTGQITVEHRAGPWPANARASFAVATNPPLSKEEMERAGYPSSLGNPFGM